MSDQPRKTIFRAGEIYIPKPDPGYVYVVHPIGVNAYKIGYTVNLEARLYKLQLHKSYELEYVLHIHTEQAFQLEQFLHNQFRPRHLSGEWFALTPEDIEYIRGLAV